MFEFFCWYFEHQKSAFFLLVRLIKKWWNIYHWKKCNQMQWCETDKNYVFLPAIAHSECYQTSFHSNYALILHDAISSSFNKFQFEHFFHFVCCFFVCVIYSYFYISAQWIYKQSAFCSFACFKFIFSVEITGADAVKLKISLFVKFLFPSIQNES